MSNKLNHQRPIFKKCDKTNQDSIQDRYISIQKIGKSYKQAEKENSRMVACIIFINEKYRGNNKFIKSLLNKRYLTSKQIDTIKNILLSE